MSKEQRIGESEKMRKALSYVALVALIVSAVGYLYLEFPIENSAVKADDSTHGSHSHAAAEAGDAMPMAAPLDPRVFDWGKKSTGDNGQVVKEFEIVAEDRIMEVSKGVEFPVWTYNGTVPGPSLRVTEGDYVKINFTNKGSMPHTIHLHGIHPANMDGVFETVAPGGTFVYEFTAELPGLYLFHCHQDHVKEHINQGMYGTFIIDPKTPRAPATELVMVMNSYDIDFDGEGNEFYTVNGKAFEYMNNPINLKIGEPVRIYLVNMTEIDPINSFHIHGNMFKYYNNGTMPEPDQITDNVVLGQGQRGIIEFTYKYPGKYMFHAHQSEFSDLGWMGIFNVTE
jgi:FtsP/CotA-like multicopper oxidase with cupredoxin domain